MKTLVTVGLVVVVLACAFAHPGRPGFEDSPEARLIFAAAERNRTQDGYLTADELADIFHTFDTNNDGQVNEDEFLFIWKDRQLGDPAKASAFFHHIDTDRDNVLTQVPDMYRIFYYFDTDKDGKVSLIEFVVVWISLSH